jgi:hypothetical protein
VPERRFDPDERVGLPDEDPIEVVRKLLEVEPDNDPQPDELPELRETPTKP